MRNRSKDKLTRPIKKWKNASKKWNIVDYDILCLISSGVDPLGTKNFKRPKNSFNLLNIEFIAL